MYASLRIQNLRGFRNVHLADLGRVNVVVGGAGTGKTTILEAMALLTMRGAEDLAGMIGSRGGVFERRSADVINQLTGSLFYQRQAKVLRVDGAARMVELGEVPSRDLPLVPWVNLDGVTTRTRPAYGYELRRKEGGITQSARMLILPEPGTVTGDGGPFDARATSFFYLLPDVFKPGFHAAGWSALEKHERGAVLMTLRQLSPELDAIEIKVDDDGEPRLEFLTKSGLALTRAAEVGRGFAQALTLLLICARAGLQTLLIDEWDAPIHTAVLPAVAAALLDFARRRDIQLFLTTHRLGGVDALLAAGAAQDDVRVIRTEHSPDGLTATVWSGADALDARERLDLDLRLTS